MELITCRAGWWMNFKGNCCCIQPWYPSVCNNWNFNLDNFQFLTSSCCLSCDQHVHFNNESLTENLILNFVPPQTNLINSKLASLLLSLPPILPNPHSCYLAFALILPIHYTYSHSNTGTMEIQLIFPPQPCPRVRQFACVFDDTVAMLVSLSLCW